MLFGCRWESATLWVSCEFAAGRHSLSASDRGGLGWWNGLSDSRRGGACQWVSTTSIHFMCCCLREVCICVLLMWDAALLLMCQTGRCRRVDLLLLLCNKQWDWLDCVYLDKHEKQTTTRNKLVRFCSLVVCVKNHSEFHILVSLPKVRAPLKMFSNLTVNISL